MKKVYILFAVTLLLLSCNQDGNVGTSPKNSTSGKGGSLATFILKGDYLYTVDYKDLSVFNVKDKKNPIKVNSINVGFDIETLFSFKNYLFIGSMSAMYIYDITNAELPKKMSQSNHFRACDPVVANNKNAYVTLHSNSSCGGTANQLKAYNIEDVKNPKLLNTRGLTQPKGLSLYGTNYLLVCDGSTKIFDIKNPDDSKLLGEIPTKNAIDIVIQNNHACIISEKSIEQYQLDSKNINNFKKISVFSF